jgi:hypothetical protein
MKKLLTIVLAFLLLGIGNPLNISAQEDFTRRHDKSRKIKPLKDGRHSVRREFETIFAKKVSNYLAQFAAVKKGEKLKPECAPDFVMQRSDGTALTCAQITVDRQAKFERIKKINYLKIEIGNIELSGNDAVVFTTQRFSRIVPGTDGREYTIVTDGTIHKETWTKTDAGWKSKGFEEFKQGTVTTTPIDR